MAEKQEWERKKRREFSVTKWWQDLKQKNDKITEMSIKHGKVGRRLNG